MDDLWQQLQANEPSGIGRWLRWHPTQLDGCVRARAAQPVPAPAADALDELRTAHQRWRADAASLGSIGRLADPRTRVVVTGQQPSLLAGPLLVIHKALAAVHWARELERIHSAPFVPVFWCASEDDDFDEIRRAHWPGAQGQIEEVLLDRLDPTLGWRPGRMVGTLAVGGLRERLVARVHDSSLDTEFRPAVLDLLAAAHAPGANFEDAFCTLLLRLLTGTGIVIVSPLLSWVRRAGAPVLRHEIENAGASTGAVIARGESLRAAGIEPQLHRRPDAVNAFWIDGDDCRHTIRRAGEVFEIHPPAAAGEATPAPRRITRDELLAELGRAPESFGFNVVTRPMVQDSILNTVAQVVGPGETAYLAQVEAAYEACGVFAPVRMPRPQAVLIPNAVARSMEKYEITSEQAGSMDAQALARVVIAREDSAGVTGALARLQERQIAELRSWTAESGGGQAVQAAADKLAQAMTKGYDTIRERLLHSRQEDERHLSAAMIRIENNLHPGGVPQERVLNPLAPFAVNHGLDWPVRLMERLRFAPGSGVQEIPLAFLDEKRPPGA